MYGGRVPLEYMHGERVPLEYMHGGRVPLEMYIRMNEGKHLQEHRQRMQYTPFKRLSMILTIMHIIHLSRD